MELKYKNDESVYFNKCLLINSKENRRVELITISSTINMTNNLEK